MNNQALEIKVAIQILKPIHEVFEAIVDPANMCNYFISRSTGRMEEGKKLIWGFPEFDMDIPVQIDKIQQDRYISYYWDVNGKEHLVEMRLTVYQNNSTVVTITEKGGDNNESGINWLKGNTEGWANFLAFLKAYTEYGINLRKGAFNFRFEKS